MKLLLVATNRERSPYPVAPLGVLCVAGAARTAMREGRLSADQDLFEQTFYLSSAMAEDTEMKLDRIARRREEWTSPVDWRRFVTRWGQKITVMMNVRPQWKYLRNYGRYMRKQAARATRRA